MDQVRKISTIIGFCIMTVLLGGCAVGSDPEPPEFSCTVVRFVSNDYSNYVLVEKDGERFRTFTHHWNTKDNFDYTNLYESLHQGCWTGINCTIQERCAVTNILWNEFSPQEHGHFFSKEEVVDEQPFAAYYRIPEHVVGVQFSTLWPSKEAVARLNAMIDDGSIEQYRVDLGY